MPSINNLEMAEAVANHQHIVIKKSLFGRKAVYQPTGSAVEVVVNEYSLAEGGRMERLLQLTTDRLAAELKQGGAPAPTAVGPLRLEVCRSKDGQFCAAQLFRFNDFNYRAASEWRVCEGSDAAVLSAIVGK